MATSKPTPASPPPAQGSVDQFKQATIQTVRALSGIADVEIGFTDNPAVEVAGHRLKVPLPKEGMSAQQLAALRGAADLGALKLRYHNELQHNALRPAAPEMATLFDALETARLEAIGADLMAGVGQNLAAALEGECRSIRKQSSSAPPLVMRLLARDALQAGGQHSNVPPLEGADELLSTWPEAHRKLVQQKLQQIPTDQLHDQTAFAKACLSLLQQLENGESGDENEEGDTPDTQSTAEQEPQESQQDVDEEGDEQDDDSSSDEDSAPDSSASSDEDAPQPPDDSQSITIAAEQDGEPEEDDALGSLAQAIAGNAAPSDLNNLPGYSIYTKEYDEVVSAADLVEPAELQTLRDQLDRKLLPFQSTIAKLATRLQRKLQALQLRSWEFDQEEGWLDPARLSRIIANPLITLSYRRERETNFRDTVVSLLIDNSGSMRGRPIAVAALSADILARTLERCGVKVEVLGFTTRSWKGGKAREKWAIMGKPVNPGRLNELRHVVYKPADSPWRRSKKNLGLMLREGLLKENIDGEALIWAHQRLMQRPEQRRILIVISDGAPVDDATLASNDGSYLENHLRQVISWIEARSPVQLLAIGIGHDVTRYYKRAVTLHDAEQLGGTLISELGDLLTA